MRGVVNVDSLCLGYELFELVSDAVDERHHADQPLLSVEEESSRASVDLDGAVRHGPTPKSEWWLTSR